MSGKPAITILGTGLMGAPMARNLLKAGFQVHAWNRTREKADGLVPDGGVVHDNPAAAAKMGDVVITMVTDGSVSFRFTV